MSSASRLLGRIGGHRRWVVLTSALGIITSGAGIALIAMATYLLTRSGFDTMGVTLALAILGVRASAIARVVARYVDRYVGHLGTFDVLTRMREWLFSAIARNDSRLVLRRDRGDVVTALIDDVDTMQEHLLRVAAPPIVAIGILVIATIATAVISPTAAIVAAALLTIAAILVTRWTRHRSAAAHRRLVALRAERMAIATEGLDAIDELLVWGRTDLVRDALATLATDEAETTGRIASSAADGDAILLVAIATAVIATITIVSDTPPSNGHRWWIAAVPLMVLAATEVLGPLLLAGPIAERTDAAAERLLAASPDPDESDARESDPAGSDRDAPMHTTDGAPEHDDARGLVLRRVSFSHPDGPQVLVDVDLTIAPGTTMWCHAPSGTGKSTLVALLTGLTPPDAGSIELDGVGVADLDRSDHTPIAAALQHDHVFDTTIRDNLLVAAGDATDEVLLRACDTVEFDLVLADRSDGLEAPTGADGSLLSGGERQRLVLSRALLAASAVLILDEPFEHLAHDQTTRVAIRLLERRRREMPHSITILCAVDEPPAELLDVIDLVVELHGGRLEPQRKGPSDDQV